MGIRHTHTTTKMAVLAFPGNADGPPNQRWAADITYIRTGAGWLYLAVVMDLYSKAIVGWSMSPLKYEETTRNQPVH